MLAARNILRSQVLKSGMSTLIRDSLEYDRVNCFPKSSVEAAIFKRALKEEHKKKIRLVEENEFPISTFDQSLYFDRLKTQNLGKLLMYTPTIGSTQTLLNEDLLTLDCDLVCVADKQISGAGRGGNIWESPEGCMMFSFTCEVKDSSKLLYVQYIASMAMMEAIGCSKDVSVGLKWPNDIYAEKEHKLAGILCQTSYIPKRKSFRITTGLGLNLDNELPTTCLNALAKKYNVPTFSREILLAEFFNSFELMLKQLNRFGFNGLKSTYESMWMHSGQKVHIEEDETDVTIIGLSKNGGLLAEDSEGVTFELLPDGNRLDFFKGLIKKKFYPAGTGPGVHHQSSVMN